MDNAESILTSIKKLLGIAEEYTQFDTDIIFHINTVFMALQQMGIGPANCFYISDNSAVWTDFISEDTTLLNSVKTYIYLKVKLAFDPPMSSSTIECFNKLINEIEWRIYSRATFDNN